MIAQNHCVPPSSVGGNFSQRQDYDFARRSPNLDVSLGLPNLDVPLLPLCNVVIEGEQEGEGEEKAKAGKKIIFTLFTLSPGEEVPDVMVVEIVETLKAFLVELF